MKRTQRILMRTFVAFVGVSLAMVVAFETGLLPMGILAGTGGSDEFVLVTAMELLTLCLIPLALRLFRFRKISDSLTSPNTLLRWALCRMLMLCVPMVVNAFLYYMYVNVAFGYMGIILLLCLAFVLPTMARCESEVSLLSDRQKEKSVNN